MRTRSLLVLACLATPPLVAQESGGPWVGYRLRTAMLLDSNLEHDETPDGAWGGVLGMGIDFQSSRRRPVLALRYEVAGHRYSIPAAWNRVSQAGAARLALRPTRRVTLETEAEVTLKGSSEDRDLGDQYLGRQSLAWQPWRKTTLEAAVAVRLRRYPDNVDRNGANRYLQLTLAQQIGSAFEATAAWRAERNDAGSRYDYDRRTVELELEGGLPIGRVTIGGRVRRQRYDTRLVDDASIPTPRRDWRYQGLAAWEVRPWRSLAVILEYQHEARRSNDPEKRFAAHQFGLSFERTW